MRGVPLSTLLRVRRALATVAAGLVAVTAPAPAEAMPSPTELAGPGLYVVALESDPQPDARRPQARRLDARRPAARQARAQDRVLDKVGDPEVLYRFSSALNGFAAELTRAQVKTLRSLPGVALVERSTTQRLDSVDAPGFVGANQAWETAGGPDQAGRGLVVGVVDSGIWPENPSFAALPGVSASGPRGFRGSCATGEQWDEADCNSKVVAARYFVRGFGEENLAASEYLSPWDGTGHGSHVAAIAAGNDGVSVSVEGQKFGPSSGMAPGARIAAYKACWTAPDPADDGCTTADAVAAVDRAVADGVDVLSFAMSPTRGDSEALARAFLNATAAGVFVTASAGNDGPGPGSVANSSPWVTTVGASTHRAYEGAVVLGDGQRLVGAMVADERVRSTEIVLAEDAAATGSSVADARLCRPGSLEPAAVADRIVVCDRGTIARVEKSAAVDGAGGAAMILANVAPDSVASDFHAVPTVHLDVADARAVKDYVSNTPAPRASLDPDGTADTPAPQVAPFSSRGPARLDERGALLKPDLTAPGVGVLAAVAPPSNSGRLWDQYSGTSMSTGAVAGLAAVVMGEQPSWTPAMVKSALTTTADDLAGVSGPLAEGAGQVDATEMLDPGLVFDASPGRFRSWLEGRTDARALNLPSIAVDDLTGRARVVRRVTNVSGSSETYSAQVSGLPGIQARVRPQTLELGPGESSRFAVVLERTTAQPESVTRGTLTLTGLSHQVRVPLMATPRTVDVPDEATGSGQAGSVSFEGEAGTDEPVDLRVAGLSEARPVGLTLEPGAFDPLQPDVDTDTARFPVQVPSGTEVLRVALVGRDSDDMDLYLYRDGELVASAAGPTADEVVTEVEPDSGDYELFVSSAVAANEATTTAQLYTWVVPSSDRGNLSLPASLLAEEGERFDLELSWSDLDPISRWFGMVRYGDSDERTFVTVN